MNFEYIESRKGSKLVFFRDYLFKKDRGNKNGSTAYVCRLKTCKVRGVVQDGVFSFTSTIREHDHLDEKTETDIMRRKRIAINSALHQPTISMKRLYSAAFSTSSDDEERDVLQPSFKSLKSFIVTFFY